MVVLVFLQYVGKLARNTWRPNNHILLLHIVVEQFRSPHVYRGGVFHHFDETFRCPVYEVFWRRIAKATVTSPTASPHKMVGTVRSLHYRGVAHHFLRAYLRFKKCTRNTVPMNSVATVDKAQSFVRRFMEGCRHIYVSSPCSSRRQHHSRNNWQECFLHLLLFYYFLSLYKERIPIYNVPIFNNVHTIDKHTYIVFILSSERSPPQTTLKTESNWSMTRKYSSKRSGLLRFNLYFCIR